MAGLDAGEEGLDAEHETAVDALDALEQELVKARDEAQRPTEHRSALAARKDALEMGLRPQDGAGSLLALDDGAAGSAGLGRGPAQRPDRLSRPPSPAPWARRPTPWRSPT